MKTLAEKAEEPLKALAKALRKKREAETTQMQSRGDVRCTIELIEKVKKTRKKADEAYTGLETWLTAHTEWLAKHGYEGHEGRVKARAELLRLAAARIEDITTRTSDSDAPNNLPNDYRGDAIERGSIRSDRTPDK